MLGTNLEIVGFARGRALLPLYACVLISAQSDMQSSITRILRDRNQGMCVGLSQSALRFREGFFWFFSLPFKEKNTFSTTLEFKNTNLSNISHKGCSNSQKV